jgi:hypothetical protein
VQAGSPKSTYCSFSCLHFQLCITKEFRHFVMRYCALIVQLPTPYFFSVVELLWCHECFVWWLQLMCWVSEWVSPRFLKLFKTS